MEPRDLRPHVARLFGTAAARTTRVGVEHELPTRGGDGRPAPIDAIRAVVAGAWYADALAFEPGGQVELSLSPAAHPEAVADRLGRAVTDLSTRCAALGVDLVDTAVDVRPESEVPLQLTTPRYLAMQVHFDTIGAAGRRMMRRTASTQVCLDWWPGRAGLEQWLVLHLVGPSLAAALARSSGPGSRLATWLAVDPGRTAFDERLVAGDDPVAAYTAFAAGATAFLPDHDPVAHLTTLFPPVRPRGSYLEVRYLDAQPPDTVGAVASTLASLLYDEGRRRAPLTRFAPTRHTLAEQWQRAAAGDPELVATGRELLTSPVMAGVA